MTNFDVNLTRLKSSVANIPASEKSELENLKQRLDVSSKRNEPGASMPKEFISSVSDGMKLQQPVMEHSETKISGSNSKKKDALPKTQKKKRLKPVAKDVTVEVRHSTCSRLSTLSV